MARERRRFFNKKEKEVILKKSKCKCVHCGKKLTIETMTIDHFYPLYLGGTNDMRNLISLCSKCNKEKDISIYDIEDFCGKRLLKYSKQDLIEYYEERKDKLFLLGHNKVFKLDYFDIVLKLLDSDTGKEYSKPLRVESAKYRDLDEVYEYLQKYFKKYPLLDKKKSKKFSLKTSISILFDIGSIFIIRRNGNIDAVITASIDTSKTIKQPYINMVYYMNPESELNMEDTSNVFEKAMSAKYSSIIIDLMIKITAQFEDIVSIPYFISCHKTDSRLKTINNLLEFNEVKGRKSPYYSVFVVDSSRAPRNASDDEKK